jgi:hypothetical protein
MGMSVQTAIQELYRIGILRCFSFFGKFTAAEALET